MKSNRTTRLVEMSIERSNRLLREIRKKDEMPYGYMDKPPQSVEIIKQVLGGRRG